jgi:hypothetical protein
MNFEFPHTAPMGCYYEQVPFRRNLVAIWMCNTYKFDYNHGAITRTIWGFYNSKKKEYYAPVNSKTIGKAVDINNTRNYTAMQLKQSPLDAFFV